MTQEQLLITEPSELAKYLGSKLEYELTDSQWVSSISTFLLKQPKVFHDIAQVYNTEELRQSGKNSLFFFPEPFIYSSSQLAWRLALEMTKVPEFVEMYRKEYSFRGPISSAQKRAQSRS